MVTGTQKSAARSQWATLRTTPLSRLSAKRVSRSWYAASAKFPRNVTDTDMFNNQQQQPNGGKSRY